MNAILLNRQLVTLRSCLRIAWASRVSAPIILAVMLVLVGCHADSEGDGANEPDSDEEAAQVFDEPDQGSEGSESEHAEAALSASLSPPTPAEEDGLIWAPISLEEQRRLRDAFRWDQTQRLSETSPRSYEVDGEIVKLPPMHYVLVYVETRDQLRELEEMGIHYDLAPLFDSEWPDTEEQSLTLPFEGDLEDRGAQFAFALIPSPVYNLIRLEALAGEDTFRAVILREVPEEARAQDGSVSWDYLLAHMTEYAPIGTENTDEGDFEIEAWDEDELDEAATMASQKRVGRRLRRFARRVARAVKRAVNGIRQVIGAAARAALPDTKITIKTHVNPRTRVPMTRAWDDGAGGYGKPLMLTGLYVAMSGQSRLTLYKGKLNSQGEATITVPRTLQVNICFEADTPTALMEMGLFRATRHCWPKHRPKGKSDTIARAIGETEFHALALMIDAREYASKVLGFRPPKATVQVGKLAQALTFGNDRAFVPCLAATRAPVWMANLFSDGLQTLAPGVGDVLDFAFATDIVLPKSGQSSRNVAVHEYGHFFFCTLLRDISMHTYSKVWSQVMRLTNLVGKRDSEAVALNEGFADWFSSQVSGSVNYFELRGSGDSEGGKANKFFFGADAPAAGRGLEENVGGPACSVAQLPGCAISDDWLDKAGRGVATVATILHDAIDREACGSDKRCLNEKRSDAAVWYPPAKKNAPFTPKTPFAISDVGDETIALSPGSIAAAVETFARSGPKSGNKLSYKAFFGALSRVMRQARYSDAEICNLFALHRPDGKCPQSWTNTGPIPRVTVTYAANLAGAGDIEGAGIGDTTCTASACTFDAGRTVALSAKPRANYTFTGWSGCSNALTSSIQLKDVQIAKNCIANFRPNTVTVSYLVSGGGKVSGPASGCTASACRLRYGAAVTLTATPDDGWMFHRWSDCSTSNSATITLHDVSRDMSCTASFVREMFVVNASATSGGSVTPQNLAVSGGGSVTLQAAANRGYRFSHYSGSPQCTGTNPRLVLSPVRSAIDCRAHFVRVHEVSFAGDSEAVVSASLGSGAACSAGVCSVDAGGSVALRMTARPGYIVVGWECTALETGRVLSSRNSLERSLLTLSNVSNAWRCVGQTFSIIY